MVREVRDNTPAAKAGVQPGDVIMQFAGKPVNTPRELQNIVERSPIGSTQPMVLLRDGKEMTVNVTCNELPADATAEDGPAEHSEGGSGIDFEQLGIQAETLTASLAEQLGVKADYGVAITEVRPGSPAALAGLGKGMVIMQANRKPVKSTADLQKAMDCQAAEPRPDVDGPHRGRQPHGADPRRRIRDFFESGRNLPWPRECEFDCGERSSAV